MACEARGASTRVGDFRSPIVQEVLYMAVRLTTYVLILKCAFLFTHFA